jgi:hypothetical protein
MTPWRGANGYRSMVPRSSATDASSPLPVLFRRSPRQAGTVRRRLTSKMVWTLKKPKLLRDEGLDPDDPAVIAAIDLVRWELSLGA